MRRETITFRVEYNRFDVGEKVAAQSFGHYLGGKIYTVTKFIPPLCPGDHAVVFVEGHAYGIDANDLMTAPEGDKDGTANKSNQE